MRRLLLVGVLAVAVAAAGCIGVSAEEQWAIDTVKETSSYQTLNESYDDLTVDVYEIREEDLVIDTLEELAQKSFSERRMIVYTGLNYGGFQNETGYTVAVATPNSASEEEGRLYQVRNNQTLAEADLKESINAFLEDLQQQLGEDAPDRIR